jgi:sialic acid synthase
MVLREMCIDGRLVNDDTDAFVIAEIGHNHQGSVEKAEQLLRMAARSGASAVKLQKRSNKSLFTRAMYDSSYTGRNSFGATYGEHRENLEFGRTEYAHLVGLANELGIVFFATAFDMESVDFLVDLNLPAVKIASGDLTNVPLLAYAAAAKRPLIVSTGGAEWDDVRRAVDTILPVNNQLALLQCTAAYPATPDMLNLSVIGTYRQEFAEVVVGLSGHDCDEESAVAAYALGGRIIEKHVTLDRTSPGSDHHFALEAEHLRALVDSLGRTRRMMGDPVKRRLPIESPALHKMAKKLVAARHLPAGQVLRETDLAIKSPGDGLAPYRLPEVVGRSLLTSIDADGDIRLADLSTEPA